MILPPLVRDDRVGFRIWRQGTERAAAALEQLLPDPDAVLSGGEIRKPGSRAVGAVVELGGECCFLKRYNCRGHLYRLQNVPRRSRAVFTWQLAWDFLARGVPVPVPLACLEERHFRLLGRSYVLMEAVPGATLRQSWPQQGEGERRSLLTLIAGALGRMHRHGCLHGDLKWDNIIVARGESGPEFRLVDLDGGRLLRFPSRGAAEKDLQRFLKDLCRAEVDPSWRSLCLHSWEQGWRDGR